MAMSMYWFASIHPQHHSPTAEYLEPMGVCEFEDIGGRVGVAPGVIQLVAYVALIVMSLSGKGEDASRRQPLHNSLEGRIKVTNVDEDISGHNKVKQRLLIGGSLKAFRSCVSRVLHAHNRLGQHLRHGRKDIQQVTTQQPGITCAWPTLLKSLDQHFLGKIDSF